MSRRPLVTVLMSTYNDAEYLAESVESVLGQTFGDFEFLIVDDGSTDGTRNVLVTFRDRRLRVVRNADQRRPHRARSTWGWGLFGAVRADGCGRRLPARAAGTTGRHFCGLAPTSA